MIEVKICVGSSCHLKGAPQVVEEFKRLISEKELKDLMKLFQMTIIFITLRLVLIISIY